MSESVESTVEMIETTTEVNHTNLLDDVEICVGLVKQLKAVLVTAHPSVTSLVRKLLFS